jgi:hypothetical protein
VKLVSENLPQVPSLKSSLQASLQVQVEDGKTESHVSSARLEEDSGWQRPRWMENHPDSTIGTRFKHPFDQSGTLRETRSIKSMDRPRLFHWHRSIIVCLFILCCRGELTFPHKVLVQDIRGIPTEMCPPIQAILFLFTIRISVLLGKVNIQVGPG